MPTRNRYNQAHRVRIVDRPRLRTVLYSLLKRFGGTHRQAAEALGIDRWTCKRLLRGTSEFIHVDTYQNIRGGLRRANTPPELELEHDFDLSFWAKDGWLFQQYYQPRLQEELRRLEPQVQTVFFELYEDQRYKKNFERFLTSVTRHPELPPGVDHNGLSTDDQRVWLALYRAIQPLVAGDATWGVEWNWREIHKADRLGAFLRHSLACEAIRLEWERDLERLNLCKPSSEWLDRLAEDVPTGTLSQPSPEAWETPAPCKSCGSHLTDAVNPWRDTGGYYCVACGEWKGSGDELAHPKWIAQEARRRERA